MLSPYIRSQLHDSVRRDALERAQRHRLVPRRARRPRAQPSVVELSGALDASAAPRARERLAAAFRRSPRELVIEAAAVTSIDAAGIDLLVEAALEMNGRPVRFAHARPEVERELELAGVHARFRK